MDQQMIPSISSRPIQVEFRIGSQFYNPVFSSNDYEKKYDSPGQPRQPNRTSHSFQHSMMPQGAAMPHGQFRSSPQSGTYGRYSQPLAPGYNPAGNLEIREPVSSTYTKSPQQAPTIKGIPERLMPSEPEKMYTKSPSENYIMPAISNERGDKAIRGETLRVILPSDSSTSSGTKGYRTPPEIPEPTYNSAVTKSGEAKSEESKVEDEIDGGTVIRRNPRAHQRLPTSWESQGSKTKAQPRGDKENSNATVNSEAQSLRAGTSHDSSPEYLPALAYQPEEHRHASGEQAPGQQLGDTRISSSQSNRAGENDVQTQRHVISSAQGHHGKPSDVNAKVIEASDYSSSSSAKEVTPGSSQDAERTGTNSATQEQQEEQQNRERQTTVVFSPLPVPSTTKAVSNLDALRLSAGPFTPPGSPAHPEWKPSIEEWLNTYNLPDKPAKPAGSAAFSRQFGEVEAAHLSLKMDTHRQNMPAPAANTTAHPFVVPPTIPHRGPHAPPYVAPPVPRALGHPPLASSFHSHAGVRSSTVPTSLRPHASGAKITTEPFPPYRDMMHIANNGGQYMGSGPHPNSIQTAFASEPREKAPQAPPPASNLSPLNPLAKEFKSASAAPSVNDSATSVVDQSPTANEAAKPKLNSKKWKRGNKNKNAANNAAKDEAKNADTNVGQDKTGEGESSSQPDTTKNIPSRKESPGLSQGRGKPNITVALPLNLPKMQGKNTKGKAPARPQQQQQTGSASSSPPTSTSKKNQSQSQQMTPQTPFKTQPATPPAGSQQSTPTRASLESTIPVLTSSDSPHLQTIEARPAFNAWSKGPPRHNRRPPNSNASSPNPTSS
ncbi:hypothetical protein F4818DRAFT_138781 [Hypoxylon cercidicola]|nr:hypothetical protein F4818DRAFT_138781 [Hypoxylon cercidicola]